MSRWSEAYKSCSLRCDSADSADTPPASVSTVSSVIARHDAFEAIERSPYRLKPSPRGGSVSAPFHGRGRRIARPPAISVAAAPGSCGGAIRPRRAAGAAVRATRPCIWRTGSSGWRPVEPPPLRGVGKPGRL